MNVDIGESSSDEENEKRGDLDDIFCGESYLPVEEERCLDVVASLASTTARDTSVFKAPTYEFSMGAKGALSTNRRKYTEQDSSVQYLRKFVKKLGSATHAANIVAQYKQYKVNDQKAEQDALLTSCIDLGVHHLILQSRTHFLFELSTN